MVSLHSELSAISLVWVVLYKHSGRGKKPELYQRSQTYHKTSKMHSFAVSLLVCGLLAVATSAPAPGGWGGHHEHHVIHVPYHVRNVHHHHVKKIAYPVHHVEKVHVPVPVPVHHVQKVHVPVPYPVHHVEKVHVPVHHVEKIHVPVHHVEKIHVPVHHIEKVHVPVHVPVHYEEEKQWW